MGAGYRGIILGCILVVVAISMLVGAYAAVLPDREAERYPSYIGTPAIENSAHATEASTPKTPCLKPQSAGDSELCAQWRAAIGTEKSAKWTMWGVWLGMFGTAGLFLTLYYTRRAVEETAKATKAMERQNELAEVNQRPWLAITDFEVDWIRFEKLSDRWFVLVSVKARIRNGGQTTAKDVAVVCNVIDYSVPHDGPRASVLLMADSHVQRGNGIYRGIIAPNGHSVFDYVAQNEVDAYRADGTPTQDVWPAIVLSVIYKDVSGSKWSQTLQVFRLSEGANNSVTLSTAFPLRELVYISSDVYISAGTALDRAT